VKKWIGLFTSKQFLMFLASGGLAAVVNFCSRILFNYYLDFTISVTFAYICGMITAFVLSKLFVFQQKSSNTTKQQLLFFTLVNVVAIVQTLIVSIAIKDYFLPFMSWDYHPDAVAHLIGVGVPIFSSFVGHKYFTFSSTRNVKET
jgi:putative flippase GtrA